MSAGDILFDKQKSLGSDLGIRLGGGLSDKILHDWAGDDAERRMYLAGTVFATIRWKRIHGRPHGLRLSSAVEARHEAQWYSLFTLDKKLVAVDDVEMFDLPDEGDEYRVGLTCSEIVKNFSRGYTGMNRVIVMAATGIPWDSVETSVHGEPMGGLSGEYGVDFTALANDGFRFLDFDFS